MRSLRRPWHLGCDTNAVPTRRPRVPPESALQGEATGAGEMGVGGSAGLQGGLVRQEGQSAGGGGGCTVRGGVLRTAAGSLAPGPDCCRCRNQATHMQLRACTQAEASPPFCTRGGGGSCLARSSRPCPVPTAAGTGDRTPWPHSSAHTGSSWALDWGQEGNCGLSGAPPQVRAARKAAGSAPGGVPLPQPQLGLSRSDLHSPFATPPMRD